MLHLAKFLLDLFHLITGKALCPVDSNKSCLTGKAGLQKKKKAIDAFARIFSYRSVAQYKGVWFTLLNLL